MIPAQTLDLGTIALTSTAMLRGAFVDPNGVRVACYFQLFVTATDAILWTDEGGDRAPGRSNVRMLPGRYVLRARLDAEERRIAFEVGKETVLLTVK